MPLHPPFHLDAGESGLGAPLTNPNPPASSSFICMAGSNSVVHVHHIFFISLSAGRSLGWFCNLATVNSDAKAAVPQQCADFKSFGSTPRSDIAGSHSRSTCSSLMMLYADFCGGWDTLRSHRQCKGSFLSTFLQCCQLVFLSAAVLSGMRWDLNVAFSVHFSEACWH